MSQRKEERGACTDRGGYCSYKVSINGLALVCDKCGRHKAVRKDGNSPWDLLA